MTRLMKFISTSAIALTTALLCPTIVSANTAAQSVTVYAGPQSVTASHSIFVTLEGTDAAGASINNELAVLSYNADGHVKTISGRLQDGLVSFEVPAQKTAGHMSFSATVAGVSSRNQLVAVVAGPPQGFSLRVEPGERAQSLVLSSKVITDAFGNPISDLSPVIIDWIDETGLKGRQTTLLSKARVMLTAQCPEHFEGLLKIKANLGTLQFISSELNALCAAGEG